jgi:hypothetical protein
MRAQDKKTGRHSLQQRKECHLKSQTASVAQHIGVNATRLKTKKEWRVKGGNFN